MRGSIKLALVILFFTSVHYCYGQNRLQLEEERNKIIEQIELTSQNLKDNQSNKRSTIEDLRAINAQIKNRRELIQNIQEQLKSADSAIASNQSQINTLNKEVLVLNEQYLQLARNMYIRQLAGNKWAYVFSASSINEAFLRFRYTKQFENFVKQKTDQVSRVKGNIANNIKTIEEERNYVEELLKEEEQNYTKLEVDLKRKDEILNQLTDEESSLKGALKNQKQEREKLNQEIEKIILAELSKSKRNTNSSSNSSNASIGKKQLSWPAKGFISGKFGNQPHPTLRNVKISNNGIDITCKQSAPISAIADGNVIGITSIPGYDYMVIVQHGNYYSVYSKLTQVIVKNGDTLKAGQLIGRLADIKSPILHFEFWLGKTKLDPERWLK